MHPRWLLTIGIVGSLQACAEGPPPAGTNRAPIGRFAVDLRGDVVRGTSPSPGAEAPLPDAALPRPARPLPNVGAAPSAPPASPRSGSGGRGRAGQEALLGRVLAGDDLQEVPIAGARILTSDGRTAVTGPDGTFQLPGAITADVAVTASHPDYVTSAVTGLAAGRLLLHLQPRGRVAERGRPAPGSSFIVTGAVADAGGAPRPGLVVVLEDAVGAYSAPAVTSADGTFALTVFAHEGRVRDGTLLVVGEVGDEWIGMLEGVDVDTGAPAIDADPKTPEVDAVRVVRATHPLEVRVDAAGASGLLDANVFLASPSGATLSLPGPPGAKFVADLPGARYELDAEVLDPVAGTRSALRREAIAIDFGAVATTLSETMLAPPVIAPFDASGPSAPLSWSAVAGAEGYRVTLAGLDGQGFAWEAFTPETAANVPLDGLAPGRWALAVGAWEEAGLTPFAVAQAPDILRPLRVLPLTGKWRVASRQVQFVR